MHTFILLAACAYEENLPEKDIQGRVVIPRAAATREVRAASDPDGDGVWDTFSEPTQITDVRLIGPVYLGAFAGIDDISFGFPHPKMGPVVTDAVPGNTFPYGGTSVGRFDFACYEAIKCMVTTGRFKNYTDLMDYFKDVLGKPIVDQDGHVIENSSTFQQYCYEYFEFTSDEEMSFIGEVQFEENDAGDFEAPFTMAHTILLENQELNLWGWMDAPLLSSESTDVNGAFSTCDTSNVGRLQNEYDQQYYEGMAYPDLLNFPSRYVYDGDWVAQGDTVVKFDAENEVISPEEPVVTLDFHYTPEEQ